MPGVCIYCIHSSLKLAGGQVRNNNDVTYLFTWDLSQGFSQHGRSRGQHKSMALNTVLFLERLKRQKISMTVNNKRGFGNIHLCWPYWFLSFSIKLFWTQKEAAWFSQPKKAALKRPKTNQRLWIKRTIHRPAIFTIQITSSSLFVLKQNFSWIVYKQHIKYIFLKKASLLSLKYLHIRSKKLNINVRFSFDEILELSH